MRYLNSSVHVCWLFYYQTTSLKSSRSVSALTSRAGLNGRKGKTFPISKMLLTMMYQTWYVNHLGAFPPWSAAVGSPELLWSMDLCSRRIFNTALPALPTLCIVPSTTSILSSRLHSTGAAELSLAWSCLGSKISGTKPCIRISLQQVMHEHTSTAQHRHMALNARYFTWRYWGS